MDTGRSSLHLKTLMASSLEAAGGPAFMCATAVTLALLYAMVFHMTKSLATKDARKCVKEVINAKLIAVSAPVHLVPIK